MNQEQKGTSIYVEGRDTKIPKDYFEFIENEFEPDMIKASQGIDIMNVVFCGTRERQECPYCDGKLEVLKTDGCNNDVYWEIECQKCKRTAVITVLVDEQI